MRCSFFFTGLIHLFDFGSTITAVGCYAQVWFCFSELPLPVTADAAHVFSHPHHAREEQVSGAAVMDGSVGIPFGLFIVAELEPAISPAGIAAQPFIDMDGLGVKRDGIFIFLAAPQVVGLFQELQSPPIFFRRYLAKNFLIRPACPAPLPYRSLQTDWYYPAWRNA